MNNKTFAVALVQERNHGSVEANLAGDRTARRRSRRARAPSWCCCRNCTTAPTSASTKASTSSIAPKPSPARAPSASAALAKTAWRGAGRLAVRAARRRPVPQHRGRASKPTARLVGKYRKMHIPDDPGFYEKFYFTPGDLGFEPIDTSVGRLGVLVCWDQWYPEAARLMALAGADLLLYPDRDRLGSRRRQDERRLASAMPGCSAIAATRSPTACRCSAATAIGHEASPLGGSRHPFLGQQPCAGPAGRVPRRGRHRTRPQLLVADVDLARSETRAPHLAVPARPPHRCLRGPAQALPRLSLHRTLPRNGPRQSTTPADGDIYDQPHAIIERDGVRYTLLGTAHVSQGQRRRRRSGDRQRQLRRQSPSNSTANGIGR